MKIRANKYVISAGLLLIVLVISGFLIHAQTVSAQESNLIITTNNDPSLVQQVASRLSVSWPWYTTRAAGLVAAASLILLILSGIGQVTGYTFKFIQPITAWATHRALGLAFLGSIILHVVSLLFDRFVPFNIGDVLIPFASSYKPLSLGGIGLGSLYVALGIISLYLTILVVVTSLLWIDKKPYTWKLIHFVSYFTLVAVFVHALILGTDTGHGWIRIIWVALGIMTLVAVIHRLRRAKTI